jgi:ABC-type glycerol-3-phosphate transport system permease component
MKSINFIPRKRRWIFRYAIIIVVGLLFAFPLIFLISGSLMTASEVAQYPPRIFPSGMHLHWHNYVVAWHVYGGFRAMLNSLIFTMGIMILQLILSMTTGFALAKMPSRYAPFLLSLFLLPFFLPTNTSVIPMYLITLKMHLLNSWPGMILPIVGSTAFGTLLFRQFFMNFPNSLVEAAKIDGASWPRIFARIVVPLAKPPVASYCAVTFLTAWNMYLWPMLVAHKDSLKTLAVVLEPYINNGGAGFYVIVTQNVVFACAVISSIPVIIVFLYTQRWFINAVAGTGSD